MGYKAGRRALDVHKVDSNQADLEPEFGWILQIIIQEVWQGTDSEAIKELFGDPTGVWEEVMRFNWATDSVGWLSGKHFLTLRPANPCKKPQDSDVSDEEEHFRVHNDNVPLPKSGSIMKQAFSAF